jgi:uncharacterized protein
MFASTNLVIELGILILIFLGWQYLVAEITGGLVLIAISSILICLTYARAWLQDARQLVEQGADKEDDDFDWRERMRSASGWNLVGHRFVSDWQMVWLHRRHIKPHGRMRHEPEMLASKPFIGA